MRKPKPLFPQILTFTILFLLIFFANAQGQSIEPDAQIVREIIAFASNAENALSLSRARIVEKQTAEEEAAFKTRSFAAASPGKHFSLEKKAFEIINEQRRTNNLPPLQWNESLAKLARLHSENMAREKFFSHAGTDGELINDRADRLGISQWRLIGENIAFNRGFQKPVESACEQWMNSPSHRQNILNKRWQESAIGVAIAPDGAYYFTQVFILN